MTRHLHRLTDRQIRTARKPIADGGNLWIYPRGNARSWIFRYSLAGRAREMGLGAYPDVPLAEARERAAEQRKLLKAGTDPIEHRQGERNRQASATAGIPTFSQCAARYIRAHRHGWRNRKHARQWVATLKTYARPVIGAMTVAEVGTDDILSILSPIWTTKTETAKRVQGRLENILDWATARGYRTGDNLARWRGHLAQILPRPSRVKRVVHHPAMPYAELPAFMAELREHAGTAARALEFTILTASRTGEAIGAQWQEIDVAAAVWSVPPERMEAKRLHRVPLTAAAIAILWHAIAETGEGVLMTGEKLLHGLAQRELHVQQAAVAEYHHEQRQAPARLAHRHRVPRTPVDLGALAGSERQG